MREKQDVINRRCRQGYIIDRYKELKKFVDTVNVLTVSKTTIIFEINF